MDPADTETRVEDTKRSLFRKERGMWGRGGGKLVKNDEQVIPRHPRSSRNGCRPQQRESQGASIVTSQSLTSRGCSFTVCGVWSEKCLHSLEHLNTSSPVGGSVWKF